MNCAPMSSITLKGSTTQNVGIQLSAASARYNLKIYNVLNDVSVKLGEAQALFLTLSLLPQSGSATFLQAVMDTDFTLALRASKYLEIGREEVITKLLSEIPSRIQGT